MSGYGPGREGAQAWIYDILAAAPEGMTAGQMAEIMSCSKSWVRENIRGLKLMFADTDTITVVVNPDPADPSGPQLYTLIGDLDSARPNLAMSMRHVESTLVTVYAQVSSLLNGTDRRTKDGRKLSRMKRQLEFMVGELVDSREDVSA